jgi:ABC-type branched-subunit amino acid transport system permease subunit
MTTIATIVFDGVAYGMILFLISIGLSLTLGLMGFANLAHGTFAMAGGYMAVALMKQLGVPFIWTLPIVFVLVAIASIPFERFLFRPLYDAPELDQVLMTFGIVLMSISVASYLFGSLVQPVQLPEFLAGRVDLGIKAFPAYRVFLIAVSVVLVIVLWFGLERTMLGARIRAAVDNRRMALSVGVNVDRLFMFAFALGSGLAALGGAIGADLLQLTPIYAFEFLVFFLIVVAVGGLGSMKGTFFAALVIGLVDTIGRYYASAYGAFFVYILTIAVLLWRPYGLFGRPIVRASEVQVTGDSVMNDRWRWVEATPWLIAIAVYFLLDSHLSLGAQILIAILFTLSLELVLGYAGVATFGQALLFGAGGYTAGLLVTHLGIADPLICLAVGILAAMIVGLVTGWVILRTQGITLLMLTLAFTAMVYEFVIKINDITGGTDGLRFKMDPILGLFRFDLYSRTAYVYALIALFIGFLIVRRIIYSPFGLSLRGIRENTRRMHAIGTEVHLRLVTVYVIASGLAGAAGVLLAETTRVVSPESLSFDRSGSVLVMLILGGTGRLYGAFLGVPIYMIFEHYVAKDNPEYWYFWVGLLLVLRTLFVRRGVIGLVQDVGARVAPRPKPVPA